MSLEATIVHLSATLEALTIEVIGLRAAMQTLTATAAVEIEARTGRPTIEVLKFGTPEHAHAVEAAGFPKPKKQRGDKGLRRPNYPATTFSRCCGAERRKQSSIDGKCAECR